MQSFIFTLLVSLLSGCSFARKAADLSSRFGLTFSPSTITASRFNSSGSVELTKFPTSPEYQSYYRDAVQQYQMSHNAITKFDPISIFHDSIKPVNKALRKQLGRAPDYAVIFLPSIFDYKAIIAADEAILQTPTYATKVGLFREAALWWYGFLDCKNLGRAPHECNDDGPRNSILLFEYEEDYLYIWVLAVDFELGLYDVSDDHICKDCGENYRKIRGEPFYQDHVLKTVDFFMEAYVRPQRQEIRAIVITGEASNAAIAELGDIAVKMLGNEAVPLITDIEASELVAYGAAVWARMTQQQPELFSAPAGNIIPNDEEWVKMLERRATDGRDEL